MKKVVIIGGGIIGLSTAYYLHKEGHSVTLIDQSNFSKGASYVNAGYITPSHIISLAAPGIINKGLRWMFSPASPFFVKPRLDIDFLRWAWAFKCSANKKKVAQSIPVIKDINILSRELYVEMKASINFGKVNQLRHGVAKGSARDLRAAALVTGRHDERRGQRARASRWSCRHICMRM